MNSTRTVTIMLLIPFSLLTGYALFQVGYQGIFWHLIGSPAGWQILADLSIALIMPLTVMAIDSRATGRTLWPWVVITLLAGSFGPLLYFSFSSKERMMAFFQTIQDRANATTDHRIPSRRG